MQLNVINCVMGPERGKSEKRFIHLTQKKNISYHIIIKIIDSPEQPIASLPKNFSSSSLSSLTKRTRRNSPSSSFVSLEIIGRTRKALSSSEKTTMRSDTNNNNNGNVLSAMNERYRVAFDVGLLLVLLSIGFALEFAEPYEKFLNPSLLYRLRYPMKPNAVPTALLPFLSIAFPLLCIFLCSKMDKSGRRGRGTAASLGLLLSVALSFVFVNSVKQACGNYRPDFAARCWGSADAEPVWKEYGKPECGNLENESLLNDVRQGRRSFPSGHTSMSFSGLFYLSLYLMYYLKCFISHSCRNTAERTEAFVWKVLISLAPLSVAVGVAITRIRDMWHHPEDVIVGSLLGTGTSVFAFSLQGFSVFADTNTMLNPSKYQRLNAEGVNDVSLEDDNDEDERANMAVRPSSMLNLNEM
jgi:diacylglycerol diphosphate phosphatase/phosphatidate phosphatase